MFSSNFAKVVLIVAVGVGSSTSARAQTAKPLEASAPARAGSVEIAVADFVQAFTTLDESRFDPAWTEDATLFFPMPVPGSGGARFTGRDAVLSVFQRFFASVRKGRSGPDYLNIKPEDLHIQNYGDTAIVSFHLTGDQGIARRTLLLQRQQGIWRVAHMHASNMALPAAAPRKSAAE